MRFKTYGFFDETELYEIAKEILPFPIREDLIAYNLKNDPRFDFEHVRGKGFLIALADKKLTSIERAHAIIHCFARRLKRQEQQAKAA